MLALEDALRSNPAMLFIVVLLVLFACVGAIVAAMLLPLIRKIDELHARCDKQDAVIARLSDENKALDAIIVDICNELSTLEHVLRALQDVVDNDWKCRLVAMQKRTDASARLIEFFLTTKRPSCCR
jgi:hypothetical protein